MDKKLIVLLCLLIALLILLCALAAPEIVQRRETLGITLQVKNATSTNATLECTRRIGFIASSVDTGRAYHLEGKTSEGWVKLMPLGNEDVVWPMDARMIPIGKCQFQLDYSDIYGKLPPGIYRVCKRFYAPNRLGKDISVMLYGEFEIK